MSSYLNSCFDSRKEYVKTGVGGSRLGVGQEQRISFTMQVVSCKTVVGGRGFVRARELLTFEWFSVRRKDPLVAC